MHNRIPDISYMNQLISKQSLGRYLPITKYSVFPVSFLASSTACFMANIDAQDMQSGGSPTTVRKKTQTIVKQWAHYKETDCIVYVQWNRNYLHT